MKPYRIACLCLFALLACYSARVEEQAIRLVKQTPARALDDTLPDQPFDDWLRQELGREKIDWAAQQGCGDVHGARPHDLCVTALISIGQAANVGVLVFVGTRNKLSPPKIDLLFVERTDSAGYREYKTLHELIAAVR